MKFILLFLNGVSAQNFGSYSLLSDLTTYSNTIVSQTQFILPDNAAPPTGLDTSISSISLTPTVTSIATQERTTTTNSASSFSATESFAAPTTPEISSSSIVSLEMTELTTKMTHLSSNIVTPSSLSGEPSTPVSSSSSSFCGVETTWSTSTIIDISATSTKTEFSTVTLIRFVNESSVLSAEISTAVDVSSTDIKPSTNTNALSTCRPELLTTSVTIMDIKTITKTEVVTATPSDISKETLLTTIIANRSEVQQTVTEFVDKTTPIWYILPNESAKVTETTFNGTIFVYAEASCPTPVWPYRHNNFPLTYTSAGKRQIDRPPSYVIYTATNVMNTADTPATTHITVQVPADATPRTTVVTTINFDTPQTETPNEYSYSVNTDSTIAPVMTIVTSTLLSSSLQTGILGTNYVASATTFLLSPSALPTSIIGQTTKTTTGVVNSRLTSYSTNTVETEFNYNTWNSVLSSSYQGDSASVIASSTPSINSSPTSIVVPIVSTTMMSLTVSSTKATSHSVTSVVGGSTKTLSNIQATSAMLTKPSSLPTVNSSDNKDTVVIPSDSARPTTIASSLSAIPTTAGDSSMTKSIITTTGNAANGGDASGTSTGSSSKSLGSSTTKTGICSTCTASSVNTNTLTGYKCGTLGNNGDLVICSLNSKGKNQPATTKMQVLLFSAFILLFLL